MFICIVPSPTFHIPVGTMITGGSDASGLPDFMRMSDYKKSAESLSKFIGTSMVMPNIQMYKAYAIWNNVLFEYSLAGSTIPTWDDGREFLFPISIKRYDRDYKTYLYVKSIETFMNIINRLDVHCREQYCNMSVSQFFKELTSRCTDQFYLEKIKDFKPTPYDMYLSQECPYEIGNILYELGTECLSYSSNAAAYLYFNYNYDINLLGELFSYGQTDDIISTFGCSEQCAFAKDRLIEMINPSSNMFYNDCAQEQFQKSMGLFNVRYLDKTSYLYDKFDMEQLLQDIYAQPVTDSNVEIVCNHVSIENNLLVNCNTIDKTFNVWDNVRINMNDYNKCAPFDRQMVKVNICKSWLDELYISIAFNNGDVENWFINLALFHLYTPSIIRTPLAEVLNSLQK